MINVQLQVKNEVYILCQCISFFFLIPGIFWRVMDLLTSVHNTYSIINSLVIYRKGISFFHGHHYLDDWIWFLFNIDFF